ncbi:MAG: zinc-dependent alcohol dehydrogenase family protein [Betaproteobacteria bacterium]|nr:zinc-dependent alcohol dehydrogenase family protein [Betaproteobacteria bacterium]
MRAMVLDAPQRPLREADLPIPKPGPREVLIRVAACGVCRTDLHIADGDLIPPRLPLILGHEIVGTLVQNGAAAHRFPVGSTVGVPWLAQTCGSCPYCLSGRENLCDAARFTGFSVDGGYAEYTVADERYCLALPPPFRDTGAAPLLCAGLIGYRALSFTAGAAKLGLYGFGASAHLVTQFAHHQGREIYAFTRPNDAAKQAFARELGARWAGGSDEPAPTALDAAIIFASSGHLVPKALEGLAKGGTVVCAGIHMSDIPSFPYRSLWGERSIRSVANLTRKDGIEFFTAAARVPVAARITAFALARANEALACVREGETSGAVVLVMDEGEDTALPPKKK